jgi:hypothetical protein
MRGMSVTGRLMTSGALPAKAATTLSLCQSIVKNYYDGK